MNAYILLYSKSDSSCNEIIKRLQNNEINNIPKLICLDNQELCNIVKTSSLIQVNYVPFLIEISSEGEIITYEGELRVLEKLFPTININNNNNILFPNENVEQPKENDSSKTKNVMELAKKLQEQRGTKGQ